jgi:hypothetical protein
VPIPGYKILTKDGLKGPYQKSSILKAITSAVIPLNARLLDLATGKYLSAAELVGEQSEARRPPRPLEQYDPDVTMPMREDPPPAKAPPSPPDDSNELKLG